MFLFCPINSTICYNCLDFKCYPIITTVYIMFLVWLIYSTIWYNCLHFKFYPIIIIVYVMFICFTIYSTIWYSCIYFQCYHFEVKHYHDTFDCSSLNVRMFSYVILLTLLFFSIFVVRGNILPLVDKWSDKTLINNPLEILLSRTFVNIHKQKYLTNLTREENNVHKYIHYLIVILQ